MIKRHLHFNNNNDFKPVGTPGHDKLFKIRPLIDKVRERLLLTPKEEYLAVDEQIIPTKARHQLKQYNPAKPHKWGYKNQVLSGVSGFTYDFDIFAGDQSNVFPSDAPVNAWLLWRRKTDLYMSLFDFELAISEHYCKAGKSISRKRGRPSINNPGTPTSSRGNTPTSTRTGTLTSRNESPAPRKRARKTPAKVQDLPLNSVRSDKIDHLPIYQKNRQLCQNDCSLCSHIKCEKCDVFLCLNEKRNCLREFHLV
ncbi:unnamed protein product [Euphydryas editha]|uniref:PiggyBac transposable element-derived protein domain-containing protein n=1 Tax=Euphydryas editha TaxID=104508 RepID=A0AAU9UXL9_EUPED|nr:unnamed protein product [Euphydryas editha]